MLLHVLFFLAGVFVVLGGVFPPGDKMTSPGGHDKGIMPDIGPSVESGGAGADILGGGTGGGAAVDFGSSTVDKRGGGVAGANVLDRGAGGGARFDFGSTVDKTAPIMPDIGPSVVGGGAGADFQGGGVGGGTGGDFAGGVRGGAGGDFIGDVGRSVGGGTGGDIAGGVRVGAGGEFIGHSRRVSGGVGGGTAGDFGGRVGGGTGGGVRGGAGGRVGGAGFDFGSTVDKTDRIDSSAGGGTGAIFTADAGARDFGIGGRTSETITFTGGRTDTNFGDRTAGGVRMVETFNPNTDATFRTDAATSRGLSDVTIDINPIRTEPGIALGEYEEIVDSIACLSCDHHQLCLKPHRTDCYKYIMCVTSFYQTKGQYTAIARLCPFGTHFDEWKRVCVSAGETNCKEDLCRRNTAIGRYKHPDGNCLTYWECERRENLGWRVSKSACCPQGYAFDSQTRQCEFDPSCKDACPALETTTCSRKSEPIPGIRNCRPYWMCQNSLFIGTCCDFGFRYDVDAPGGPGCVEDPTCRDECPRGFDRNAEPCRNPNTIAFRAGGPNHCRSYFQCFSGEAAPMCCPKGFYFNDNPSVMECEEGYPTDCVTESEESCLIGFRECESRPYEDEDGKIVPDRYRRLNVPIYHGLPCPPGTLFDSRTCGCTIRTVANRTCHLDFNFPLVLPPLMNSGSFPWYPVFPEESNSTAMGVFRGDAAIALPPYNNNEFRTFFYSAEYQADGVRLIPGERKMTLFSNCRTGGPNSDQTSASLDISYYNMGQNRGEIRIIARNDQNIVVQLVLKNSQPGVWYRLTVIYDGNTIQAVQSPLIQGRIDVDTANRQSDIARFNGFPSRSVVSPMIGGCTIEANAEEALTEAFYGEMKNVMVTKCIPDHYQNTLPKPMPL